MERHLRQDADMLLAELRAPAKRGEITGWSTKSRARMSLRLATLDYAPLFTHRLPKGFEGPLLPATPAMVTLTLPHDWETVAGTPAAFKKLVNDLRQKFLRAWGVPIAGAWKMEFQGRRECREQGCHDPRAPHLHILTTAPPKRATAPRSLDDLDHLDECSGCQHSAHVRRYEFPEWLSRTWADVVGHPDADERRKHERAGTNVSYDDVENYGDPKRIGVYFSKHGAFADKEYQNQPPDAWRGAEGGGARFWGYWVIRPLIVSQETHEALIMHIMSIRRECSGFFVPIPPIRVSVAW